VVREGAARLGRSGHRHETDSSWGGMGHTYFSDNSGLDWKDITPAIASGGRFGGIFFLNPSKAWVTVNHVSNSGIARTFDVVSTDDGGSSWSSTAISLRQEDYGIHVWDLRDSRASSITFVDNLNGWMNIVFEVQTSNTWATALLLTSDGGRTWKKAPDAPTVRDPQMLMMSPSWGYLYGGDFPAGFSLYVTRDAFHTWEQVNLEVPGSTESSAAGLPKFEDSKTGYLEVHGIHREANRLLLSLALMRTSDGGRTWKIDRMVSNLSAAQAVQYRNPAIADSEWIFTAGSSKGPMLTKLSEGARVEAAGVANASPKYKDLRGVSWASPMARLGCHERWFADVYDGWGRNLDRYFAGAEAACDSSSQRPFIACIAFYYSSVFEPIGFDSSKPCSLKFNRFAGIECLS
jgi:photosystem II stability/assembly factor-like uncharacterized protein